MPDSLRIAVLPDFREEGWISMEYCADRLLAHLPGSTRVDPRYHRLATRFSAHKAAINFDRFRNRFRVYPRYLRSLPAFDRYHVVDHSYAHLVHELPALRTGVYCHDIDAFLSVLEPERVRKPKWFRAMSRRLLTGLQKAAVVFHNSMQTRQQLLQHRVVEEKKLVHAPLGVAEEFLALPGQRPDWLPPLPWVLHVGSCVPRKRIDVLLSAVAKARESLPGLQLVKVGGEFSAEQRELKASLALPVIHRRDVPRAELAEVYRAAPLVLIPSESEGFGLPALEALACGAAVLASDIPALREAAGDAGSYLPVGDMEAWSSAIVAGLRDPESLPDLARRLAHASRFTWENHARIIRTAYEALA